MHAVKSTGRTSRRAGAIFSPERLRAVLAGFLLAALPGIAPAQTPPTHQHSFGDAEGWAHVFDDPKRDSWQKPHEVIQALALTPDAVVADLGAGTGYFSVRLAHMLSKGTVYAVDVEPQMVKHLAERAKTEKLPNMIAVQADLSDPLLPGRVDVVLVVDVYHHIEAREKYFSRLRNVLVPGGRVAIIDFRRDSPEGPPKAARVSPSRVKAEMKRAGYELLAEHRFLPRQYFLVVSPVK